MTSRSPVLAISKLSHEYYSTISFLKNFIILFPSITIGKSWKPCQTGVILATESVLSLQHYYLNERKFKFFLTGRLTQDCLENLFSCLRTIQPIPNALQFKTNLKLVCMAQYLKNVSKSNYEEDDREFFVNFLNLNNTRTRDEASNVPHFNESLELVFNENEMPLGNTELNALYNIAGKSNC